MEVITNCLGKRNTGCWRNCPIVDLKIKEIASRFRGDVSIVLTCRKPVFSFTTANCSISAGNRFGSNERITLRRIVCPVRYG